MPAPEYPIFYDPSQRRVLWTRRLALTAGVTLLSLATLFCASLVAIPLLKHPGARRPRFFPDNPARAGNEHEPARNDEIRKAAAAPRSKTPGAPGLAADVVGGFFVSWDSASVASLKLHARELTHLFPGWLHLNPDASLLVQDSDPSDETARRLAMANKLNVLPLINNYTDSLHDFDEARLHVLLSQPTKRAALIRALLAYVERNDYPGILLDLETERADDRALLAVFATEAAARFHASHRILASCTQAGDPNEAAKIAAPCDFIVPMLYDQHWASGDAGPIAPEKWVLNLLDDLRKQVPASKIVMALGNYAYDWERDKSGAKTLTFGEAMLTARESLSGTDGVVRWDAKSQNPYFTYEEDKIRHDVWLMDAVSTFNLARAARARGISGRALWYVGSEDPSLWSYFGRGRDVSNPSAMNSVRYGFEIDFEGEGELLDVAALPQPGRRRVAFDRTGAARGEVWETYPTACVVRRSGKKPKTIALTFDDGPDPNWTPKVLDALEAANVPATFFVIGVAAEQYPGLLRRAFDDGHDIGNHSFYHPNLADVGDARATLELDATRRAIEAAIGRSTTLFRPPYGIDAQPETAAEARPIELAQKLGYLTVAEGLDPRDWDTRPGTESSAESIAAKVVADADAGLGNIVLLHDSGGDRQATVDAIPLLVSRLRAKGYRFVTVSELAGAKSRDTFFPPLTGRQKALSIIDRIAFGLSSGMGRALAAVFLFSIAVGSARTFLTAILALKQSREPAVAGVSDLSVSVVIAAYNEEKVIARTISALLESDYENIEVIVVDDGSRDDTSGIVAREFGDHPKVRLIVQANGGKARALTRGIAGARGEILVGLDADTLFAPDALRLLLGHFSDPTVGAVAGNIRVGNRANLWTRLQALEYTTSQNFDRRAFALLNSVTVVPGCIGAWRKRAVLDAGGYQTDTLAEDADLTWRVRKLGWKIVVENRALAFTEAPERYSDLLKQRFRWTFGTLQVLYKHRDVLFRPKFGAFGLVVAPSLWLFSVVLPALSPAADLGILLSVLSGNLPSTVAYAVALGALEATAALLAFSLDRADSDRRRDLWLLPLQRVLWRYLLLRVLWRALRAAIAGARAGWGKLERTGNVKV